MRNHAPHEFSDGHFLLQSHHIALWAQSVNADKNPGILPSIAVLVAFRGAGASISDLMAHLETEPKNVLFGELAIDIVHPFKAEKLYTIKTRMVNSERKFGKKSGAFDRVALSYRISIPEEGLNIALVTQTWIVGRPQEVDFAA